MYESDRDGRLHRVMNPGYQRRIVTRVATVRPVGARAGRFSHALSLITPVKNVIRLTYLDSYECEET
jgi:hypothetical protein